LHRDIWPFYPGIVDIEKESRKIYRRQINFERQSGVRVQKLRKMFARPLTLEEKEFWLNKGFDRKNN
jgi:hypothetical protein